MDRIGLGLATLIALVSSVAVSSCDSAAPRTDVDLTGVWELTSAAIDGRPVALIPGGHPELRVQTTGEGGAIAGCESSALAAVANGRDVEMRVLESASMFNCLAGREDPLPEGGFPAALRVVSSAQRVGEDLTLSGPGVSLHFVLISGDVVTP